MFSSKQLSADQIASIKNWAKAGDQMADIQKKIREELNFPVTYMDARLLILDLGIDLETIAVAPPVEEEIVAPIPTGETKVSLDHIAIPGTVVSGHVSFSDGETAVWKIDQAGRPSLDPRNPEYQPSEADIIAFQTQLRAILQEKSAQGQQ